MHNKKRVFLIIGVIFFFGSAAAFGISQWYYHLGGSVMDGPGEFYANTYRMYSLFLSIAKGLLAAGAVSVVMEFLLRNRSRSGGKDQ